MCGGGGGGGGERGKTHPPSSRPTIYFPAKLKTLVSGTQTLSEKEGRVWAIGWGGRVPCGIYGISNNYNVTSYPRSSVALVAIGRQKY